MAFAQKENVTQVTVDLISKIKHNTADSKTADSKKYLNEFEIANFQRHFSKIVSRLEIKDYQWLIVYPDLRVRLPIAQSEEAINFIKTNNRRMVITIAEDIFPQVREELANRLCVTQDVRLYARGNEECRNRALAWSKW